MGKILVMTTVGIVDTNTLTNGTREEFKGLASFINTSEEIKNKDFSSVDNSNFADALDRALGDRSEDNNSFNGSTLSHGSRGNRNDFPITIIGYYNNEDFYIIGVGKHISSSTYKLCYLWQPESKDLKENSTYDLNIKDKKLS